jgi:uncharacterized protein (TIGR02996 family)
VELTVLTGSPEVALDALLAAWRTSRSAALAEAIDLVTERIDAARPRDVPGKTVADRLARWAELERANRPADVGELMRTLLDVPGHELDVEQLPDAPQLATAAGTPGRLGALLAREPDPRIARGMVEALDKASRAKQALYHHWKIASAIVVKHGDYRTLAALAERGEPLTRNAPLSRKNLWPKTALLLREALRDYPEADAYEHVLARVLADAPKPPPAGDGPALLAAIYQAPRDDAPRQVYADFLLERGDPRGEFINLQLVRAAGGGTITGKKRENALLRSYVDEWLGAIAPAIQKTHRVFERGFLHSAHVGGHPKDTLGTVGASEWGTVVDLDIESWKGDHTLVTHEAMRALRVLRGVQPAWMELPLRVERIVFGYPEWFSRHGFRVMLEAAGTCAWQGVRHLECPALVMPTADTLDNFYASSLAKQLSSIRFDVRANAVDYAWRVGWLAASPIPVVQLRCTDGAHMDWEYELVAQPDGRRAIEARNRAAWYDYTIRCLADALAAIGTRRGPLTVKVFGGPDIEAQIAAAVGDVTFASLLRA